MNELQIFKSDEFGEVRTVVVNGEPWFVGKDVAELLGYSNSRKAITDHVDNEDKTDGVTIRDAIGREQKPTVINESGLYSLILSSKLPTAKRFKKWVTSEVLPTIRKHGMYATEELLNNPDFAIKAFTALKEEKEKNKKLEQEVERLKPKEIFCEAVSASSDTILVRDLAKILRQNGLDTGEKRLFKWLREKGYLIKHGSDRNRPTQKSMNLRLFEVQESAIPKANGEVDIRFTTKVTGKGQQFFIDKFFRSVEI